MLVLFKQIRYHAIDGPKSSTKAAMHTQFNQESKYNTKKLLLQKTFHNGAAKEVYIHTGHNLHLSWSYEAPIARDTQSNNVIVVIVEIRLSRMPLSVSVFFSLRHLCTLKQNELIMT